MLAAPLGTQVCLVGETIIDEIVYVKPAKFQDFSTVPEYDVALITRYCGGVLAVYKDFRERFTGVSLCSNEDELLDCGTPILKRENSIVKQRIVDSTSHNILSKINYLPKTIAPFRISAQTVPRSGPAMVYDYGHGFLDQTSWEEIGRRFQPLFASFQLNSSSFGRDLSELIGQSDYAFFNLEEARYASGSESGKCGELAELLAQTYKVTAVVTDGHKAAAACEPKKKPIVVSFNEVPGPEPTGAGDAFQASFALAILTGLDIERSIAEAHRDASQKAATWFHEPIGYESHSH